MRRDLSIADLAREIRALGVPRAEIARQHDCSDQFIFNVLGGRMPCPPALRARMITMIEERKTILRAILEKSA